MAYREADVTCGIEQRRRSLMLTIHDLDELWPRRKTYFVLRKMSALNFRKDICGHFAALLIPSLTRPFHRFPFPPDYCSIKRITLNLQGQISGMLRSLIER